MDGKINVGYALTGSFCTFSKSFVELEKLSAIYNIIPILSENSAVTDTRFGKAQEHIKRLEEITGHSVIKSINEAEPIGPKKLLDILAKYNVKVSFFVKNSSYLSLLSRADQEGHTVAVHTYSHDYNRIYASEEAFYADMSAIRKQIVKYTRNATSLFRFPGGSSNTISQLYNRGIMTRLAKALTEMGYTYFDWNVDSDDAGRARTPEEVFNNITKGLRWYNDAVVLQHDTKEYSVNAVERVITWALVKGYTFAPLTEDSPTCHHPINN